MINLSRTENNIVFIVFEKNTTNQLIKCKSIWKSEFSIKSVKKDEIWFEQIVYEIEIAAFDKSMSRF
jgi:hypothetical protein